MSASSAVAAAFESAAAATRVAAQASALRGLAATSSAAAIIEERPTRNIAVTSPLEEVTLTCSDGMTLAAQSWKSSNNNQPLRRILCLHGWMDNCRSFHYLAPTIAASQQSNVHIVALDFVGHGLSSHKSTDGSSAMLAEGVFYVAEAIQQLQWSSSNNKDESDSVDSSSRDGGFTLIGHSMGAAVSCLYAAAFPEQVQQLVLLDGAGPLSRRADDTAKHLRAHVERRLQHHASGKPPRVYPSLEAAIKARCHTARTFPGKQWLSETAAREMVVRGTKPTATHDNGDTVQFCHDARLQLPSLQYFVQDQVDAVYHDLAASQIPTALLAANDGWPVDESRRQELLRKLQPTVYKSLPGSHHFHADPDTAPAVADEILQFLKL